MLKAKGKHADQMLFDVKRIKEDLPDITVFYKLMEKRIFR